jgi:hypothetical protein
LSLEANTQENADLILQNQVVITERDGALASLAEELAESKAMVIHFDTTQEQNARALESFRIDHQSMLNKCNEEMAILSMDKHPLKLNLLKPT